MVDEIKKIVDADDTGWKSVQAAGIEADKIRSQAQRKAEDILSAKILELSESVKAEQERILIQARQQAAQTLEEADRYIDRMQRKKASVFDELLEDLLKGVTGS